MLLPIYSMLTLNLTCLLAMVQLKKKNNKNGTMIETLNFNFISLTLNSKANWSKINKNIKTELRKLSGIFHFIEKRSTNEINIFLDDLAIN